MAKSKVAQAKEVQGYQDKPSVRRCLVCRYVVIRGRFDRKFSCGIGGFKVKANAVCDEFEINEAANG